MIKLTENQREILQALLDGKDIEYKELNKWETNENVIGLFMCLHQGIPLRIKPRTIIVNGVEVPEPMKVKPENGTGYYVACSTPTDNLNWNSDLYDSRYFNAGICHSTPEAATLHWEAMIKPSKIVQE